jgi:uncharacterized protein YjiS (DUF1127 family)
VLRTLDDHQLRDIGLMRHQIEHAVNGRGDLRSLLVRREN